MMRCGAYLQDSSARRLTPVVPLAWLRNAGVPIENALEERMQNPHGFTIAMGRGNLLPELRNGKTSASPSGTAGWSSTRFPPSRDAAVPEHSLGLELQRFGMLFPPWSDDTGHPTCRFSTCMAHLISIKEKKRNLNGSNRASRAPVSC